jgi:hypothetical protein
MIVCVYCGANTIRNIDDKYIKLAAATGKVIAEYGMTLLYGGGASGMMGALAHSAMKSGGRVIGVLPKEIAEHDEMVLDGLDKLYVADSFASRRTEMVRRSDAFVTLPGALGTLDEVTEVLQLKAYGDLNCPVSLVNIDGYYNSFIKQLRISEDKNFTIGQIDKIMYTINTMTELCQYIEKISKIDV